MRLRLSFVSFLFGFRGRIFFVLFLSLFFALFLALALAFFVLIFFGFGFKGLGRDDCIMVGDSKVDVDAAKGVGMPVVIVSYGFAYYPVESLNADKIIDNFGELPEAIKLF